jgi:cation diffusion facilitator CzcD-associated flavoprotein CzcO
VSTSCDVAVIGAGPYGLSIAAHLRTAKMRVRVFGSPMATWRSHMPAGMFLKSEGFASSLSDPSGRFTLRRFCVETGRPYGDIAHPVSLETFTAYGEWFRERAVGDVDEREVTRVDADPFGFLLVLSDGEVVSARAVVVATGVMPFAYVPPELRDLPESLVTHASAYASFDALRGREVAVVGAGQSALETAVLLREQGGIPQLVVRGPLLRWNPKPTDTRPLAARLRDPDAPLGRGWKLWLYSTLTPSFRHLPEDRRIRIARTTLGPAGAWWLRERLTPEIPIWMGRRIVDVQAANGGARLTLGANGDGQRQLHVDHVIAGTGYRVELDRLSFLSPELRAQLERVRGAPRLSRHFESSCRGLYFAGLPAANTFGPAMRFVCGSTVAARRIAAHVRRRTPG